MRFIYRFIIISSSRVYACIRCLLRFNPVSFTCNHLVGKDHTHGHRIFVGTLVMFTGVLLSKSGIHAHALIHVALDGVGYLMHGIGALPFVEIIEKWSRKD